MILLVGQYYKELVNNFKQHSIDYHILKDSSRYRKESRHATLVDFADMPAVLNEIDKLPVKPTLALSTYEQYIVAATHINKHLGVTHTLSLESAQKCTDKTLMRAAFATAPKKISPAFTQVRTLDEAQQFAAHHDFPLILKPANLAKSLLVTKCNNMAELEAAFNEATALAKELYKKYTNGLAPKFVLEEFIEGPIYSVDAFINASGEPFVLEEIVDYKTAEDIGFDDTFHYSRIVPTTLSQADQDALRECAALGIKALGMRSCPAHVEIIMSKQGPRIVEIGARNGGYRPRMYGLANGIDIIGAAVKAYRGEAGPIKASRHDHCAVLEIFPKEKGIFTGVENEDTLKTLPSLYYYRIAHNQDELIGKAKEGFKAAAIVIILNTDKEQFERDLMYIRDNVQIAVR